MLVLSLIAFNCSGERPILLTNALNIQSFSILKRGTVKEFLFFISREVAARTPPNSRNSIQHELDDSSHAGKYICHCFNNDDGLCVVVITDGEYSARIAYRLISEAMDEIDSHLKRNGQNFRQYSKDTYIKMNNIERLLDSYQHPEKVDKVAMLEDEIDDVKKITIQNIDSLLKNRENIDILAEKSADLST
jgi:synaptobrevin family protein YKT6